MVCVCCHLLGRLLLKLEVPPLDISCLVSLPSEGSLDLQTACLWPGLILSARNPLTVARLAEDYLQVECFWVGR